MTGEGDARDRGERTVFSSFIVWYLVLAGAGSGALAVASASELRRAPGTGSVAGPASLGRAGFVVAPPLVALASFVLMLDLGRPERIWGVVLHPFHSVASIGAFSLTVTFVLAVATVVGLFVWKRPGAAAVRALLVANIAFALVTMTYSGLLLSTLRSVPFWETPLIPVLFVVSSFSSGIACIMVAGFFLSTDDRGADALWTWSTVLSLVELVVLVALLVQAAASGVAAQHALGELLHGSAALLFWPGIVGAGIVFPIVCHALSHAFPRQVLVLASMIGVLAGTVCLRYGIVDVGIGTIEAAGTVL